MTLAQRLAVAWVAVMANAAFIVAADGRHSVYVGLLTGITCAAVGSGIA